MNKSHLFIALSAACCLTFAGCANKEKQLEGKWKVSDAQLPANVANNPMASQLQSRMSSANIEFKPDKKYTWTIGVAIEGEWALTGSTVTLTPKTIMGMSIDQVKQMAKSSPSASMMGASVDKIGNSLTATMSDDGKTLSLSPPGSGKPMTFTKENP